MARKESVRRDPKTKMNAIVAAAERNKAQYGEYAIVCQTVAADLSVTTPVISTFLKKYNKIAARKGRPTIGLLSRSYTSGGNVDAELESLIGDLADAEMDGDDIANTIAETETDNADLEAAAQ